MSSLSANNNRHKRDLEEMQGPVPVTVLSGFLGAGKTTLLKYILETKHKEQDGKGAFKCAVIVNDMAELNIDEAFLVGDNSVVQSDDVVALQNGCVCCTLQNDLIDQITKLAASGKFDYMILEASGVSEPAEIAKLFVQEEEELCEEDHDHDEHHEDDKPVLKLATLARLDTLVTVVDASMMLESNEKLWLGINNTADADNEKNNLSQLLAEQVEYANVIVLNKLDLVKTSGGDDHQLEQIKARVALLNPQATLLTCRNSRIDNVHSVVNTRLYRAEAFGFDQLVQQQQTMSIANNKVDDDDPSDCCVESKAKGLEACCQKSNVLDSGMSQVVLADNASSTITRHDARFGITSFLYKARRPFHPNRFNKEFISKYFLYYDKDEEDDEGEEEEDEEGGDDEDMTGDAEIEEKKDDDDVMDSPTTTTPSVNNNAAAAAAAYQQVAKQRQTTRTRELGQLLRSKGFLWLADSHDLKTSMSHAGNLITLDSSSYWTALNPKAYASTTTTKDDELRLQKDWVGTVWKDRRQEIVFIGQNLKHKFIQALLDECLLDDDEFEMGVDYWKATMGDAVLEIAGCQDGEE